VRGSGPTAVPTSPVPPSRAVCWPTRLHESASQSPNDRGKLKSMSQAQTTSVLDRMLDPLSRCLDAESAKRVAELSIDPVVQARVDVLAERANEGLLTPEDRAEYEAYINVDDFIVILKMKTKRYLGLNGSS
jgi:hypothetical protein